MCVSSDHFFLAVYICIKFSNPLSICEISNMLLSNSFSVTCNKEIWFKKLDVRKLLFNNFEMLNIIYYLLSWKCSSTRQQHSSLGSFIKISAKHNLARESFSDELIWKAFPLSILPPQALLDFSWYHLSLASYDIIYYHIHPLVHKIQKSMDWIWDAVFFFFLNFKIKTCWKGNYILICYTVIYLYQLLQ